MATVLPEAERGKTLKPIRNLHFVTHPGLIAGDSERLSDRFKNPNERQKIISLFDDYRNQSRKLAEDEIMVIFLHKNRESIKEDLQEKILLQPAYLSLAKDIKAKLKNRAIILSGSFNVSNEKDVNNLKEIIQARGYEVKDETLFKAWGEFGETCSKVYPDLVKMTWGIKGEVEVQNHLTEIRLRQK